MPKLKIEVIDDALDDLDRYARAKGRTLEALITEWIEFVCEHPDRSLHILREMASIPLPLPEPNLELDALARRAGLRRRKKRLKRPIVSFDRRSGQEETSQDGGLSASGASIDGGGLADGMSVGAGIAGNGPAF